ncbi:MAG: hypothetical protein KDI14_04145 [Halioglobus sp.]|nr:hypothetical protein [Halioglobus sp.]
MCWSCNRQGRRRHWHGRSRQRHPKCVAGERACPPEDCGGVHGYQSLLGVLFDPSHPEHESLSHWIPRGWGPELFKPEIFPAPSRVSSSVADLISPARSLLAARFC